MGDSFKVLAQGTLTTSSATLYTVTSSGTLLLSFCSLCNKYSAAATVTLKLNSANLTFGKSIATADGLILPVQGAILTAGATIAGLAGTASAIDYYICGDEVT